MTAPQPGKVLSINKKGIVVEFKDSTKQGYELGRRFGNAAGLVIPHEVATPLKVDETFETGQPICYNTGFFEIDFFDSKRIVLKNALNVRTVLWESLQTLEDASSITEKTASKLVTSITKVKTILVNFDQTVTNLVKVGDTVQYDSVLCYIQDEVTAAGKLFTDETIDTLKMLGAQSPRAHLQGIVESVEVYYHGDTEDMSETVLGLAQESDKRLKYVANSQGKKYYSGSVDAGFRIEGKSLSLDCAAIRIYITTKVPASVGDKGVFVNQMKTVFSQTIKDPYRTEDGKEIDAVFGAKSIDDRIVNSAVIIGAANMTLDIIAEKAIEAYF